ncbi:S-adenosyl-L-methionine-dependent methyltransferase [Basidiobolus meristosporus CBS 931.73]|uniref:S-adenosyl-L-methionine-dependent methyltransferase n=1 Tax=Basidiobolus meristosporus CBS 931.73 TaxID=1314790 RepID=A0A1Y1ZDE4_9FUNG|nr:S-adenosyl-L-methionine-dependent methyltransferase [Basidiobolus meristosporus CBS 931.73]|eukprot:ORY08239.1 S-adenosyl-L-methionine-dependent methyltransferase [Basidiobolus meristosporus CBS 931.73]
MTALSEGQQWSAKDQNFPPAFLKFLEENEIDPTIYGQSVNLPRYIRINPTLDEKEIVGELKKELNTDIWEVPGVPGFYGLDGTIKIASSALYKAGKVFGIDLSSGLAVYALDVRPDDHILDLCCAPGAKLCMIADSLGKDGSGTVTGVDISEHRAATCRSLLKKYKVFRARVFVHDGTTFNIHAPTVCVHPGRCVRKGGEKSHLKVGCSGPQVTEDAIVPEKAQKPFYAPRLLRDDPQHIHPDLLYDKYDKWGWDNFEKNFLNPDRINTITKLQKDLISRGWELLKSGGVLVYSTCSLSRKQNEEVIEWFIRNHQDCELQDIPHIEHLTYTKAKSHSDDIDLSKCARFEPLVSSTSGFFVARLKKK